MDALSEALQRIKVRGAVYFDAEFDGRWGVTVPCYGSAARYHLCLRGQCWVRVASVRAPVRFSAGDLIVVPHGAEHVLCDSPSTRPKTLERVLADAGYRGRGTLIHSQGDRGSRCRLICGHLEFERPQEHLLLGSLPPLLHVRAALPDAFPPNPFESLLGYLAREVASGGPGRDAIADRIAEIIFALTVRHLALRAPGAHALRGYSDPALARALDAMHAEPNRRWTVDRLAARAGMSRTRFAVRFSRVTGRTPIGYLSQWRLARADELLREGRLPLQRIAEAVGYASESALSRAYKRAYGMAPRASRARSKIPGDEP